MCDIQDTISSSFFIQRGRALIWLLCSTVFWFGTVDKQLVSAQQPKPLYWKQRLFYIPYQLSQPKRALNPVRKVQLMISRDGVSNWQVLQEAEPNVQGFSYNAPEDGEYWFALRHIDRRGQPWPSATINAQMRIVVDTQPPQVTLSGTLDATGSIVVRYEATDVSLNVDTLRLEARPEGGSWIALTPGLHDVSHPDRLLGRVRWQVPANVPSVEVRASISDRADQRGETETAINLTGPALTTPNLAGPSPRGSGNHRIASPTRTQDPFQASSSTTMQDWPANNRKTLSAPQQQPTSNLLAGSDVQAPPPIFNPYTTSSAKRTPTGVATRTPARLIGEDHQPSLSHDPPTTASGASLSAADQHGWHSNGGSQGVNVVRAVNSRTFEVDYNLESVGPWGIAKVELWGTHDGGNTWQSYGVDNDNRSPVRVTVPSSGAYGFRILVDGVSGVGSPPPRSGDKPELVVEVDLDGPQAEILSAAPEQGELAGHLRIDWKAGDSNLEDRPVSLYYGSYADGPWSAIATQLPNNGSYTWRMERHLPERFFVRLEVRDLAGNVTSSQTPTPITISRSQPSGTLRGVRPVEDENWQNETARR